MLREKNAHSISSLGKTKTSLIILFSKVKFLGRKDKRTIFTTVMSESKQGFYFICEIYLSNWSRNFRSRLLGSHLHWRQVGSWDRCQRLDYHIWRRWWLRWKKVGQQQEQLWNWTVRDYFLNLNLLFKQYDLFFLHILLETSACKLIVARLKFFHPE